MLVWVPIRSRLTSLYRAVAVALVSATLTACGTTTTIPPAQPRLAAPDNLSISTEGLIVTLSWEPVAGASSYRVYWRAGSTVSTASGSEARASAPSYLHQAPAFGLTYAYLVVAVDDGGSAGTPSQVITTAPSSQSLAAPSLVTATAGDRRVTLTWDQVPNATGYEVDVYSTVGTFTLSNQVISPLIHGPLLNRIGYHYRVRARFGTDVGPWSDPPVSATPMPAVPGSPVFTDVKALIRTDLNASGTPNGVVQLSWSPAQHAQEYQVYVRTDPDPSGLEIPLIDPAHPLKDTTYQHMPVDFGVAYWYRVEAINDGVASPVPEAPEDPDDPDFRSFIQSVRASVPLPLTSGVPYPYVIRGFDSGVPATESADTTVTATEPTTMSWSRDLAWTPPSMAGATAQRLYRAESPVGPYSLIAAFDDLAKHDYRDEGLSPYPVPTGLTVSTQVTTEGTPFLLVTWSPVSDAISGYRLHWWEQTPLGAVSIGSERVFTSSYQLDAIQSGSVYTYAVQVEGYPGVSPSELITAP